MTTIPVTLTTATNQYLTIRQARGLSRNTIDAYGRDLRQFQQHAAGFDIAIVQLVSERLVNRWIDAGLMHLQWSRRTAARKLEALRGMLAWCRSEGFLQHDPCAEIRIRFRPKRVIAPELQPLLAMISAIGTRDAIDLRDRAILLLLLDPALRAGEVAQLDVRRDGYAMPTHWVDTRHLRAYARPKGGEDHDADVVGIESQTAEAVQAWERARAKHAMADEAALFVNARGWRMSRQCIYLMVRSRGRDAGMANLHPHMLRHRRVGEIVEKLGLKVGSAHARHRNVTTTADVYGAHATEVSRNAVRTLAPLGEVSHG